MQLEKRIPADDVINLSIRIQLKQLADILLDNAGKYSLSPGTVELTLDTDTMRLLPAQPAYDEDEETNSRGFAKPTAPPPMEVTV